MMMMSVEGAVSNSSKRRIEKRQRQKWQVSVMKSRQQQHYSVAKRKSGEFYVSEIV